MIATATNSDVDYSFLYANGEIAYWYLYDCQKKLYDLCDSGVDVVTNCHRRYGKDSVVLTYAAEQALQNDNFLIRYGAPTLKQAYEISDFILTKIFSNDSKSKPLFVSKGGYWDFKNGSKMTLFGGADKEEVEKGRGVEANLIIISEFAFFKYRPSYLLREVLSPQLLTTKGQKIIVSTVPEDLTHPYVAALEKAEKENRSFIWDINKSIAVGYVTEEQNHRVIKDCNGIDSDAYQREYLCKLIPSSAKLIVPEAQNDDLYIVDDVQRPEHYTPYVSVDLGLRDFSVALFGYHDFAGNCLVIEAEHHSTYTTTEKKVTVWKEIEKKLNWNKDVRRYSDNDQQQIFDLNNDHKYAISAIKKRVTGDNSQDRLSFAESVINKMRIGIKTGRVKIKSECKFLIATLKYGIWNERRTDFERSEKIGHFDAGICLAYLYDNVAWHLNPVPEQKKSQEKFYGIDTATVKRVKFQDQIANIYGKKKRRIA